MHVLTAILDAIFNFAFPDETADDDTGRSRGASIGDGDHDGSSVDPSTEHT